MQTMDLPVPNAVGHEVGIGRRRPMPELAMKHNEEGIKA